MQHILNALSGPDNQTIDIARVLWVVSVLAMIVFEAHAVWDGKPFDPVAFATGAAAILAGGGAAVGLKANAEPKDRG